MKSKRMGKQISVKHYASGGFVGGFAEGMNRGLGLDDDDRKKKKKNAFPDAPSDGGLYRKGGVVVEPKPYSASILQSDLDRSDVNYEQSKLLKKALKDTRK